MSDNTAILLQAMRMGDQLPPEIVNYMYENGAFLLFLGFPSASEFGIDYKSWKTGEKFMGLKMIPPGVHFVYCSIKSSPRIGFFHNFKAGEIVVKKWNKQEETFEDEKIDESEIPAKRRQLKSMDNSLAPYPYENYRSWYGLTDFITPETVDRVHPICGRITAQAELVSLETEFMENAEKEQEESSIRSRVDRENPVRTRFVDQHGLPIMKIREGYEIRFQEIPQLTASQSRIGIEYSDRLYRLLRGLGGDYKQLLAEMQIAFVCFLIGQVFEGFEQWKRIIHLLCCCPNSFGSEKQLFMAFVRVLFFQLKECPTDFFVDIVSRDNFLTTTLSMLFANISESAHAGEDLKKKSEQFKQYLSKQFKWDFNCN
uniref:Protein AAR2 homolog n=1 Tax=Caenorhabditis japonica TaxID=281687 RepID=A0A8R1DNV7_CAEJA